MSDRMCFRLLRWSIVFCLALLSLPGFAQQPAAPAPTGGNTLIDPLQLPAGEVRTLPKVPRVGAWSVLLGRPQTSALGRGVQVDKPGQAIFYPTLDLLAAGAGTIEFQFYAIEPSAAGATEPRVLLDTWPVAGPSRFLLTLLGDKLTLAYTDDKNQAKTLERPVNWGKDSQHKIAILWDADELVLLVNGRTEGKLEKPGLPREIFALTLGNGRDLKTPAKLAMYGLRLATVRDPTGNASNITQSDQLTKEELDLKQSQGYQRRMYPGFEHLRRMGAPEVNFAYASAYADIGDLEKAMQTVTTISRDPNNSLYIPAVFKRAELLSLQKDYVSAYEQLQVLTGSPDLTVKLRAMVRQASFLSDQGNKQEAMRLIGDLIARYPDNQEINEAFLIIANDRIKAGDPQKANDALDIIGLPGAGNRPTIAIGQPTQFKVSDADLNIRLTNVGQPVVLKAIAPDGKIYDTEVIQLRPAFSKGLYTGNIEAQLGEPKLGDGILQVQGNHKVRIIYVDRLSDEQADKERFAELGLATDSSMTMLAQSAKDIFQEAMELQKKHILDERWELISTLPKTASAFFRDPETGALRKKPARFDKSFINNIKPGQNLYVELIEPDGDITPNPDTITVEVATRTGKKIEALLTETGPHTGIFATTVKTAPTGEAKDGQLEVASNDEVTARYKDETPAVGSKESVHLSKVLIKAAEGKISCNLEITDPQQEGGKVYIRAYRVSDKNSISISVEDRDLDTSEVADKVTVKAFAQPVPAAPAVPTVAPRGGTPAVPEVFAPSGPEITLTLVETGLHTGIFTGTMKVSSDPAATAPNIVKAKVGEEVVVVYQDLENMANKPVDRVAKLRVNSAENASIQILRKITPPQKPGADPKKPTPAVQDIWEPTKVLVPTGMHRITLMDGDILPTSVGQMYLPVTLKSSNGSTVVASLESRGVDPKTLQMTFTGDLFVRLGDQGSPTKAFFSQTGMILEMNEDESGYQIWSYPALNVQGKDTVSLTYKEALTSDGKKDVPMTLTFPVVADAKLDVLNMQGNPLEILKPGMPFDVQVTDPNGDLTPQRDTLKVQVASSGGDTLTAELVETDNHSGTFSLVVKTIYAPTAANDLLETPFGGKVTITYNDELTILGTATERKIELVTRPLAESEGMLLTKVYDDPKFEVETLVRLGESRYAVGAAALATAKLPKDQPRTNEQLQEAARLMQQVIDRFPTSEYVVESLFLTGKVRLEEQKFDEAEKLFTRVIDEYPDSDLVPQALYQLVLLFYNQGNATKIPEEGTRFIEKATETAMRLVYGHPKSPLVADAFLRISEFYYNRKDYLTAAFIYKRVSDRFPDNPRIELIRYRMATAYYKAGMANDPAALNNAIRYYLEFSEIYPDHELADDAIYWAAQAYNKQNNYRRAFTLLTKLLITYVNSDMKAYAQRLRDTIKEKYPNIEAEPI
jgi:TolA-binding protein